MKVLKNMPRDHPYIVRLHDAFMYGDPAEVVIVMGRMETTLDDEIRSGKGIPIVLCRTYLGQILEGLHFLHDEGVLLFLYTSGSLPPPPCIIASSSFSFDLP